MWVIDWDTTPRAETTPGEGSYPEQRRAFGLARVAASRCGPRWRPATGCSSGTARRSREGRLVLARFADGTLVVKRASGPRSTAAGEPGWWLLSDNPDEGVDSRHRGPVPADDVVAVVVARTWPRPALGRRL